MPGQAVPHPAEAHMVIQAGFPFSMRRFLSGLALASGARSPPSKSR